MQGDRPARFVETFACKQSWVRAVRSLKTTTGKSLITSFSIDHFMALQGSLQLPSDKSLAASTLSPSMQLLRTRQRSLELVLSGELRRCMLLYDDRDVDVWYHIVSDPHRRSPSPAKHFHLSCEDWSKNVPAADTLARGGSFFRARFSFCFPDFRLLGCWLFPFATTDNIATNAINSTIPLLINIFLLNLPVVKTHKTWIHLFVALYITNINTCVFLEFLCCLCLGLCGFLFRACFKGCERFTTYKFWKTNQPSVVKREE